MTAHQKSSLGGYDHDEITFLPLQYGHQPGGSPVRGWHHPCHRLHRRGGRVRQHPGTAGGAGLAALQQALGVRADGAERGDEALLVIGV